MKDIWILGAEITSAYLATYQDLDVYFTQNKSVNCDEIVLNYLGRRYAKKVDRGVQFSLYASENLLQQVPLSEAERKRTGIMFGNNYAGWPYVEDQMYGLYKGDTRAINPYVATAWFPAAAQGELSIRNGLYGVSKTFSQDQLSSAVAIDFAIDMLMSSKIDYVITGGYESLSSPLIYAALKQCNLISDTYAASDTACSILLSSRLTYHSRALAKISCIYMGNNLTELLNNAKQSVPHINLAVLTPMNMQIDKNHNLLNMEKKLIAEVYDNAACEIPTQAMGFTAGASFALQVAVALWMLQTRKLQNVLVIGRDYDASQYCILVIEAV